MVMFFLRASVHDSAHAAKNHDVNMDRTSNHICNNAAQLCSYEIYLKQSFRFLYFLLPTQHCQMEHLQVNPDASLLSFDVRGTLLDVLRDESDQWNMPGTFALPASNSFPCLTLHIPGCNICCHDRMIGTELLTADTPNWHKKITDHYCRSPVLNQSDWTVTSG
jgi:hypothetical protein